MKLIALKSIFAYINGNMRNLKAALAFIMICVPFTMWAQNKDGSIHIPDTLEVAYVRITGVEITGNKLTKPQILVRELDFKIGDSLATFQKGKSGNFNDRDGCQAGNDLVACLARIRQQEHACN